MRAGIYIRKSRESKDEAFRLEYQRERLPMYAVSRGWEYVVFDEGYASAANGKTGSLKARARLEQEITARKIDIVLVVEFSRLSRDETAVDYFQWLALCAKYGVKLATLEKTLDPKSNTDWFVLLVEAGFSSIEMRTTSARFREGREQRFLAGKWMGGSPPPPYRWDRNLDKPVIDPEQLPKMQRLWQLAESMSAMKVASQLGMPEIAVRRAIADDRLEFYQSKRMIPSTGQLIDCDWEPVMTQGQAERIRVARRTRKTNDESRPFAAFLSGLGILKCGYCGRTVKTYNNSKTRKDGSRLDYYCCVQKSRKGACSSSRMIPQPNLDEKILVNVFGTLKCLDELARAWQAGQKNSDTTGRLDALKTREDALLKKRNNLVIAVAEGTLARDEVRDVKSKYEAELASIQRERDEVLAQVSTPPDWDSMTLTREEFDSLDLAEQRQFLKAVIQKIAVYRDSAFITYRFPRSADGSRDSRIHLPPPQKGGRQHKEKRYTQ